MRDLLYAATVFAPAHVASTPAIGTQKVKSVKTNITHQAFLNAAEVWNSR